MARVSWLDEKTKVPLIDEQVKKLDHFTKSLADGVVDKKELEEQQRLLVDAMKAVEKDLDDKQHEKVTRLLVELSAYNIMRVAHEMMRERDKQAFK